MLQLLNNCRAGSMSVFPENWKTQKANPRLNWRITYWFYDDNLKVKKQVVMKGMNGYSTLQDKQAATQVLLDDEIIEIRDKAFNRITKKYGPVPEEDYTDYEIDPETPFLKAFYAAMEKINCSKTTRENIKSALKYISQAAQALNMTNIMIKDLRRRHIKALLAKCGSMKKTWSANTFNAYRSYLGMIYSELLELEATETNAPRDIKKQKHAVKKRRELTPEECKKIDEFTKEFDRRFWLLIHIFFHSGSRTTELFNVQREHVDIERQMVKYLILKGNNYVWKERPIKNIVLDHWREAIEGAGPKDYIFSKKLKPGPTKINPRYNRRWKRHIKGKLGIDCDFYSLKYLNTTQMMDALEESAEKNAENKMRELTGHASEAMIVNIYDTRNKVRKDNKIKQIANSFAG